MKKILPVVVLLAILSNTAGYYFAWEINRCLARREIRSMLENGSLDRELTTLRIYDPPSDPAFRRIEEREIEYHGNLFDVAREVNTGKTLTIYCIHDKKEQKLIAGMKSMHNRKKTVNLLKHLVTTALPVISTRTHPQERKEVEYPLLCQRFSGRSETPFSPPPEKS